MDDFKVQNKVLVVTGGASGIGLATAWAFARNGAKIALVDRDRAMLDRAKEEFKGAGVEILPLICDVTHEAGCRESVDQVIAHFGGIDILFNNAGITQRGLFVHTKISVFERVMAVNFFGAVYMTKAALESLIQRQGMIIVNESIAGVAPLLGRTGYSASKHALHGLFTSLRCELAHKQVHVMIVCPGFVQTHLQDRALGWDGHIARHEQTRVGKSQTPEFVADQILKGARKRSPLIVLTGVGRLGYLISRFFPAWYERLMTRQFRQELE